MKTKPNRYTQGIQVQTAYSDRPQIRKVNNIGNPDICLNCPYPTCKRGSCDRTVGMKRKKVL